MSTGTQGQLDAVAEAASDLEQHGFAIIPGFLTEDEVAAGRANIERYFPPAEEFYAAAPSKYAALRQSQVAGLLPFPFLDAAINDQLTSPRLVHLARRLLRVDDIRLVGAQLWAKYAGAADYDQPLHQDFANNTLVCPREGDGYGRLECFVYYSDVTEHSGPTYFLSNEYTKDLPRNVTLLSRDEDVSTGGRASGLTGLTRPDLYEHEVPALGPAGTLVIYTLATFHRGSAFGPPPAYRWLGGAMLRPRGQDWSDHICWPYPSGGSKEMDCFLTRATVEQRNLLGFPPPGDGYWNDDTLTRVAARYPGMDMSPYRDG